ncbi:MAG: zinc metallopeptidase, partial [Firmicutes bacterium]|nr:zinc metallopeptidase [Bacillota bacterium]
MYIGYSYYYVLLPAILLTLYAQSKVKNTFNRYSSVRSRSGVTGAEAAQRLLHAAGIYDVRIEGVRGSLT